ncbi:sensor histidine kinase [Streptosporangium sp. NBC_01756]|uniref:sensor histidine kinase n=1 Tax=Streptosporangium sp. NBC_01756 TaxID=2975950 RepID=UPI002DD94D7B|nr:HAMP domain-containing sensor histidine kinase [Streptosporangium sp. NBC_01756]WSC87893.1 HAMP domain-containing histidine kinase [Streptosporangium sp. NBC_01756]
MITRKSRSVRTRLTLVAVAVAALGGLLVTAVLTFSLYKMANGLRTNEVAGAVLDIIQLDRRAETPVVLPQGDAAGVQVLDSAGRVVASTASLTGAPRMADFTPPDGKARADREVCDIPAFPGRCMVVVAFRVYRPQGDLLVYSADDVVPWYVQPEVFALFVGASLLFTALAGFGTYHLVTRALRPVNDISDNLAEITATDFGKRVPVPRARDEVRHLAETINQTLDRLEAAAEQQRRFASDASHDLRSPLTAMRAQVEEALLYPEDTDWDAKAAAMLGSLDRLQAIVSDLLMLTRLDAGTPAVKERIDLSDLLRDELDRRPRRVPVIRKLTAGLVMEGDRLRLSRLLTNLLDNAERHTASRITVSTAEEDGMAVLEVLDDGEGVPRDQWEIVFRRFTRLDASRSRDAGGTGLGLAIAREIAQAHGGTLGLAESSQGARFVLRLPLIR